MMSYQSDFLARRGWLFTLVVLGLALSLAVGCGKKDQDVQTDPDPAATGQDDEDTVDLEDDTFAGETTGEDPVQPESTELVIPTPVKLQDIYFDYDKYDLSAEAREALTQNGRMLREQGTVRVVIEGHCDERGTVQYNLALGEKRANEVRRYLQDLGISSARIEVVSYGKERPFAVGNDEQSWAQNRRAHFVVQ